MANAIKFDLPRSEEIVTCMGDFWEPSIFNLEETPLQGNVFFIQIIVIFKNWKLYLLTVCWDFIDWVIIIIFYVKLCVLLLKSWFILYCVLAFLEKKLLVRYDRTVLDFDLLWNRLSDLLLCMSVSWMYIRCML